MTSGRGRPRWRASDRSLWPLEVLECWEWTSTAGICVTSLRSWKKVGSAGPRSVCSCRSRCSHGRWRNWNAICMSGSSSASPGTFGQLRPERFYWSTLGGCWLTGRCAMGRCFVSTRSRDRFCLWGSRPESGVAWCGVSSIGWVSPVLDGGSNCVRSPGRTHPRVCGPGRLTSVSCGCPSWPPMTWSMWWSRKNRSCWRFPNGTSWRADHRWVSRRSQPCRSSPCRSKPAT